MDHRKTRHPIGGITGIIVSALFLLAPAGTLFSVAAETSRGPDSIDLSAYKRTAGPVIFVHTDHGSTGDFKASCSDCHHTTARDQIPEKCSICHLPLDDSAAPTDAVAFHKLCIGCHKTEIEHGNKRLSLACDSCHTVSGIQ
jgi:hypothetical protein